MPRTRAGRETRYLVLVSPVSVGAGDPHGQGGHSEATEGRGMQQGNWSRTHYILHFIGLPPTPDDWVQNAQRSGFIGPGERQVHRWTVAQSCKPKLMLQTVECRVLVLAVRVAGKRANVAPIKRSDLTYTDLPSMAAGETIVIELGSEGTTNG